MLLSDDPGESLLVRHKGAAFAIPGDTPHQLRIRNSFREEGLRNWKHYHVECESPRNWKWASVIPAFGRLALETVYDMSEPGGVIASRSSALDYQTFLKQFFAFLGVQWRESGGPPVGVATTFIPVAAFVAYKKHVDRRVAANEIKSKSGYQYKGAVARVLRTIWDKDPAALGPGWSEVDFVHDDFEDDNKQREPYSATETRRLLDGIVKLLQEAVADGRAENATDWLVDIACYTMIGLRLGIESECLDRVTVGSVVPNPDRNTITIRYLKRRSPSNPRRSSTVTAAEPEMEADEQQVGALKTAGGILALMLRRAADYGKKADEPLWLRKFTAHDFQLFTDIMKRRGLRCDHGSTLKITRTKFRVTWKTAQNVRHQGMLSLMPEDNSRDVNARHYLESERMQPIYDQTVENAALEALAYALEKPKVVTLDENADESSIAAAAVELDVLPEEVAAALSGETDVWIASCRNFYKSPFDPAGKACSKAFYGCLGCRNALITRRVLPRLLRFFSHISVQRTHLTASDWNAKFGTAYRQITEEILPKFPKRMVSEARIIAQGLDANLHLPPEMLA